MLNCEVLFVSGVLKRKWLVFERCVFVYLVIFDYFFVDWGSCVCRFKLRLILGNVKKKKGVVI